MTAPFPTDLVIMFPAADRKTAAWVDRLLSVEMFSDEPSIARTLTTYDEGGFETVSIALVKKD